MSFLLIIFFLVNVIHLVLIGFTIIFEVLQNMFTQSSNFCRPIGVLDIRITSSAYMRQDMKDPLGSSTADEFILSRSNAKLFIKMLKRIGLSGQPCLNAIKKGCSTQSIINLASNLLEVLCSHREK